MSYALEVGLEDGRRAQPYGAANSYAFALGIAYAGLFVLWLIFGLNFLGGLLPLNGADHILHILTALIAFRAYFSSRGQEGADVRRFPLRR